MQRPVTSRATATRSRRVTEDGGTGASQSSDRRRPGLMVDVERTVCHDTCPDSSHPGSHHLDRRHVLCSRGTAAGTGALDLPTRLACGSAFSDVFSCGSGCRSWHCLSRLAMVFIGYGGFAVLPSNISLMMTVGVLMAAIFTYIYGVPWQQFRRTVARADWPGAEHRIRRIRQLVGLNLLLGLATVVLAAAGAYFS